MLLVLTDVLTCPRCGPEFGLVILADRLEDRRVREGSLGCANCRELYPVRGGVADLRFPPGPAVAAPAGGRTAEEAGPEAAVRLAALIGVTGGPGLVLVAGDQAPLAARIAEILPDVGFVALGPAVVAGGDQPGTSRILSERLLPLRDRSVRGAALTGSMADALLEEGARVLAPGARLVLDPAPADAGARLDAAGLAVLLDQDDVMVASRAGGR